MIKIVATVSFLIEKYKENFSIHIFISFEQNNIRDAKESEMPRGISHSADSINIDKRMKVKGVRTKNMADAHPKRRIIMANKSAKKALEQFKMQAASEVGVNLNNGGYNGDLTSRQAGSIGGQMVKKMIESYENSLQNGSMK